MPDRPFTFCKKTNCNKLTNDITGYCDEHKLNIKEYTREKFKPLDNRKTKESIKFYTGSQWIKVSRLHRSKEPFCRRCKAKGYLVKADLVHHNPERETLLAMGKSPYDEKYLESLCHNCHQVELRAKQ